MRTLDLFETLKQMVHCEYVSDLLYVDYEVVRVCLNHLNLNDYEMSEICDAVEYFGGCLPENVSKQEAWNHLLEMKYK